MTTPTPARHWPWLCAAALLLAAGLATAVSAWVHWLPCRGSMLNGSIAFGYQYPQPDFSDACLHRMDAGIPFPTPTELAERNSVAVAYAVAALALAGLAWLPLVLGLSWSRRARLVALTPSAVSLLMAANLWTAARTSTEEIDLASWAWVPLEITGIAAVIVVWRLEPMGSADRVRLLLLAWGATAFGLVHQVFDYALMINLSDANWDTPPGTGYGTAVVLALAAIGLVVVSVFVRRPRPSASSSTPERALTGSR